MSVWVTFYYDVHAETRGIYTSEMDALRAVNDSGGFLHAIEVNLPCDDFLKLVNSGQKVAPRHQQNTLNPLKDG